MLVPEYELRGLLGWLARHRDRYDSADRPVSCALREDDDGIPGELATARVSLMKGIVSSPRPGPDSMWMFGSHLWIGIEAKSEASPDGEVSAYTARQAAGHMNGGLRGRRDQVGRRPGDARLAPAPGCPEVSGGLLGDGGGVGVDPPSVGPVEHVRAGAGAGPPSGCAAARGRAAGPGPRPRTTSPARSAAAPARGAADVRRTARERLPPGRYESLRKGHKCLNLHSAVNDVKYVPKDFLRVKFVHSRRSPATFRHCSCICRCRCTATSPGSCTCICML
jgi:hypothetical protein